MVQLARSTGAHGAPPDKSTSRSRARLIPTNRVRSRRSMRSRQVAGLATGYQSGGTFLSGCWPCPGGRCRLRGGRPGRPDLRRTSARAPRSGGAWCRGRPSARARSRRRPSHRPGQRPDPCRTGCTVRNRSAGARTFAPAGNGCVKPGVSPIAIEQATSDGSLSVFSVTRNAV